jgi:antitoxin (DNA-binding transcriptional repressor) of toxin-antitoxin stability system
MAVIHISEADAARDLPSLLAKVRAGAEVLIDDHIRTIAVLRSPEADPPSRKLSEAIRLSEARGSNLTLDSDFGNDLEDVIRAHEQERPIDPWESF